MSPVKSPQELSSPDIGKKDKHVVEKGEDEELPPGWTMEMKTRKGKHGIKRDRYYTDPVTGYIFRSFVDVQRYLKTGQLGRLAKKPKNTETDNKIVEVSESKEQNKVISSPETPRNKRPLEDESSVTKGKSELPQRASKRLAGITTDAPPPPPPPSPPEAKTRKATRVAAPPPTPLVPKTRHAKRQAGMEIEPPLTTPPEPQTHKATTKVAGAGAEPTPPPPPSSPPPPETRTPVVLAVPKENNKKPETEKPTDNDGNADMAAKPPVNQENLEKAVNQKNLEKSKNEKSNPVKNQDLPPENPAAFPPASQPPPATIPPSESPIPTGDSRPEKPEPPIPNMTQESSINFCLNDFWTDPCIEFAVKTLTGAIPFGELNNKVDNFPVSPLEVPMDSLWTDPCIEFAVKTLTGAIPVGEDPGIQDYLKHQSNASTSNKGSMGFCQTEALSKHNYETGHNKKEMDSVGNGGNVGFHQQVNGNNGRPRFFQ